MKRRVMLAGGPLSSGRRLALGAAAALLLGGAAEAAEALREPFGSLPDGTAVDAVVLRNSRGMQARIIAYGATLQSLETPDRRGALANIVLSHPDLAGYLTGRGVIGATVGRFANRIRGGRFTLDGRTYALTGPSHGGRRGFDKLVWTIDKVQSGPEATATFGLLSPDGDQGFPGEMRTTVTYALDEAGALSIRFEAVTSKPTVVNLTNHAYFNLGGVGVGDVMNHRMTVLADQVTVVDADVIPTGAYRDVAGGPFDFRRPRRIGERIEDPDPLMRIGKGYNHNFVVRGGATRRPKPAVTLADPISGRVLKLSTTEPGVQIYTGFPGGVALEPQHYPDSPNHPAFPSTRLDPGCTYRHTSVYRFSVDR